MFIRPRELRDRTHAAPTRARRPQIQFSRTSPTRGAHKRKRRPALAASDDLPFDTREIRQRAGFNIEVIRLQGRIFGSTGGERVLTEEERLRTARRSKHIRP